MKKLLILLMHFLTIGISIAQNSLVIKGKNITGGKLYLKFEDGHLHAFDKSNNETGSEILNKKINFYSLGTRTCNIYIKWLNPLKYTLKWSDSTFVDEDEQALKSFFSTLAASFGPSLTEQNKDKENSLAAVRAAGFSDPADGDLQYPPSGFNSLILTTFYLQLRSQMNNLSSTEINDINNITSSVIVLDNLIAENVSGNVDMIFQELAEISSSYDLLLKFPNIKEKISEFETRNFNEADKKIKSIPELLSTLKIGDKFLEGYFKTMLAKFVEEAAVRNSNNRELVKKLWSAADLLDKSVSSPGDVKIAGPKRKVVVEEDHEIHYALTEYYKNRFVELEDGNRINISVTLVEKEYDKVAHEMKIKSEKSISTIQFRKYDPVAVFISAGGFYGNLSLRGYGVNKDLQITEDNISRDDFVVATFLNFSFGPSRYLSPLIQVGIDPTKKRPFMLIGGGFSVPVARIAFSAGGVWTWSPTLQKLRVGDTVLSTTNLDEDIKPVVRLKFEEKKIVHFPEIQ